MLKQILSILLAVLFGINASSQQVEVKVVADKKTILLGEPLELRFEARFPSTEPIRFFAIDTIPHFEFLEKPPIDTTDISGGTMLSQVFRVTSFDSGHWVIPPYSIAGGFSTDSFAIDVVYTSPFDSSMNYHDIKDVIDAKEEEINRNWWWWAAGAALLLITLLVILLSRKKPEKPKQVVITDPFAEAKEKLAELRKGGLTKKEFYTRLVDIFRDYVEKRKGISSQKQTTDDIVLQLKSAGLSKEGFDKLAQALRLSDFVKFAKYEPQNQDDEFAFASVADSINALEENEKNKLKPDAV